MVNDILVIKCNVIRKPKQMKDLQESINKQKETGTVIRTQGHAHKSHRRRIGVRGREGGYA